jgi:hypothetical protein
MVVESQYWRAASAVLKSAKASSGTAVAAFQFENIRRKNADERSRTSKGFYSHQDLNLARLPISPHPRELGQQSYRLEARSSKGRPSLEIESQTRLKSAIDHTGGPLWAGFAGPSTFGSSSDLAGSQSRVIVCQSGRLRILAQSDCFGTIGDQYDGNPQSIATAAGAATQSLCVCDCCRNNGVRLSGFICSGLPPPSCCTSACEH